MSRGPIAFSLVIMEREGKTLPLPPPWGGPNPTRFYKHEARTYAFYHRLEVESKPGAEIRVNSVVNVVLKGIPNGD